MKPWVKAVTRSTMLTAVFVSILAVSVVAAPQRGGGGRPGGGQAGGRSAGDHSGGSQPREDTDGRPHSDGSHGHLNGPRGHIIVGGFYDPFWGPFYPYGYRYPYGWYRYPDWPYDYSSTVIGDVKTEVTPKQTEIYVDGFYAGVADDFDGIFHRLSATVGGHAVTLHLEGYRTVTRNIYVQPNSTYKLKETMEKLPPGEITEPVPPAGRSEEVPPAAFDGAAPRQ